MNSPIEPDLSVEPSVIRRLSEEQKERLSSLLDHYMLQLEEGLQPDATQLVEANQDLAEALNSYLQQLKVLHEVAAGFSAAQAGADDTSEDPRDDQHRLDDFVLSREIGRGGMGVVYEARQCSLGRRVAIKVLPFASVLDAKQITRFKNEAQAAAQVQHPNIVPVYAVGADRGVHYYAMRFVEGLPLDRVIARFRATGQSMSATATMTQRPSRSTPERTQPLDATVAWSQSSTQDSTGLPPLEPTRDGSFESDPLPVSKPPVSEARQQEHEHGEHEHEHGEHSATQAGRTPTPKPSRGLLDFGEPAGSAVDLVPASYLEQYDRSSKEFFREVARLGVQAARALHAAHEYGIVHRDIKPSNLMVDETGKLWVTDFGLARFQTDASLTKTGDLLGTLRYMSPEQAAGNNAFVDHRTDIYSLAATLYELVTFRAVFTGDNNPTLLKQIESDDPPLPRSIRSEIPGDLETVVMKAMSKLRDDRYETAADFADDLQRVVDNEPTVARPLTLIDRLSQWTRRNQRIVLIATTVTALLACVLGVSVVLVQQAKQDSDRHLSDATRHLQRSREAIEDLGLEVAEELQHIPGAARLQQEVLSRSLSYYQAIARDQSDDPTIQADIALAHSKIGAIYDRLREYDEAIASYQESLSLFTQLQLDDPTNHELQRSIGICQNNIGQTETERGDLDAAAEAFAEALAWLQPLLEQAQSTQAIADLARTENNLAMLMVRQKQVESAEAYLKRAIRRLEPLVESREDDVELATQLAKSCYNLATLLKLRDSDKAEEYSRMARRAYENLPDSIVSTPQHVVALALIYNNHGAILASSEKYDQAIQLHRQAAQSLGALLVETPNDMRLKKDLALTRNTLGQVYSKANQLRDALRELADAVELQQELAELAPYDTEVRHTLGGIYNNLGVTLELADQTVRAQRAFQLAAEAQRKAVAAQPQNTRYRMALSRHLVNLGRMLRRGGAAEQAATVAHERLRLEGERSPQSLAIAEEMVLAADLLPSSDAQARKLLYETAHRLVDQAIERGLLASIDALPDSMNSLKKLDAIDGPPGS